MTIDAISAARQTIQQIRPESLEQQSQQVDAFRQSMRNGAANESGYRSGLDDPSTLSDRFFSTIGEMQEQHNSVMRPVQERLLGYVGDNRPVNESAPPFDFDHDDVAQMLPSLEELDLSGPGRFDPNVSVSEQLGDLMSNHNDKMRDILRMQFDVGRAVVEEGLVSGIAGRSARNLDMLLRGQ